MNTKFEEINNRIEEINNDIKKLNEEMIKNANAFKEKIDHLKEEKEILFKEIQEMGITKISVGELKKELSKMKNIDNCVVKPHVKSMYIGSLDDELNLNENILRTLNRGNFSIPFQIEGLKKDILVFRYIFNVPYKNMEFVNRNFSLDVVGDRKNKLIYLNIDEDFLSNIVLNLNYQELYEDDENYDYFPNTRYLCKILTKKNKMR